MEIFFDSNVRTRNNMDFRFVLFILNNFSACLSSWSSSMPKTEIYHGISPVTEKILECFGRTDCVTDLSQPGDPSQHRSVCSVQGVAKSGPTERRSLKLYWTKSCRNPWLGEMPSNVIKNFFVTRRWGQTIGELCFMYLGVAVCPQVTVSECSPWRASCKALKLHTVFPSCSSSPLAGSGANFPAAGSRFSWVFVGWVEKRETQSLALQSVVWCRLRLLPFFPVGSQGAGKACDKWQSLGHRASPLLFSGSCCRTSDTSLSRGARSSRDGHVPDPTPALGCCLSETLGVLQGRGSTDVCVPRTDSLPQPQPSSSGRGKAYLLSKVTLWPAKLREAHLCGQLIFKT